MAKKSVTRAAAEDLLLEHFAEIERVIGFVCRRQALHGDDADEFGGWVKLRLVEDDYRVLRSFSGQSTLSTYLTAVILNLARDYRIKRWGRWRPSAAAKRLGEKGILLDTLLHRDGYSLREATEILLRHHTVKMSPEEIAEMATALPQRVRRRFESEEVLATLDAGTPVDGGIDQDERAATLRQAEDALGRAVAELPSEDRLVLKLRFLDGLTVATIARALGLEQAPLYKRIYKLLRVLRERMEERGLDAQQILEATGWSDAEIAVDFGVTDVETMSSALSPSTVGEELSRERSQ